MPNIVAAQFEDFKTAEAATRSLKDEGVSPAAVDTFFLNAAGQHARFLIGGDQMADPEARTRGNTGNLTLYCSADAHSSIEKGAITLGIGQDNVRKIPVDEAFRMRVDVLREKMAADRQAGKSI